MFFFMLFPSSGKNIYSHTELPVPNRHSQAFFAKPLLPLTMGLTPPKAYQPHPTYQADARGHVSCIHTSQRRYPLVDEIQKGAGGETG